MDLFYVATTISVGNGRKTTFWDAPWINGLKPKDTAHLIYLASQKKKSKVANALHADSWIAKIKLDDNFSFAHVEQFVDVRLKLRNVHLNEEMEDSIVCDPSPNGEYSAASAYKAQFMGAISNDMKKMV